MALVSYTGKNVLGVFLKEGATVRLLPGINEVDDDQLTSMKTNPLFQERIKCGKVQIMMDAQGKDGKRSVEDMLTYIPKIMDVKLLKKIIDTDGRDKVIFAARDQLEAIKNPSKKADESEHFA